MSAFRLSCKHPGCGSIFDPAAWHAGTDGSIGHYRTTVLDIEAERRARLAGLFPLPGEDAPAYRARVQNDPAWWRTR